MLLLASFALFAQSTAAAPSRIASRGVAAMPKTNFRGQPTLHKPSSLFRKLAARADAPAVKEDAPKLEEPKKKEGLEALYGGLYDGEVFETYGWDPLRLSAKVSPETLLMYREAELTHGRVAMLAAWGILAAERWHPLFNSPDGTAMEQAGYILKQYPGMAFGMGLFMSAIELLRAQKVFKNGGKKGDFIMRPYSSDALTLKDGVLPGDLGWDPLNCKPEKEDGEGGLIERQTQEINNGRLAMLAVMGILMQEATTGVPQG